MAMKDSDMDDVQLKDVERSASSVDESNWDGRKAFISCEDLNYHVGKVHILRGINATFAPGELVALMGASGAGKTTLLNQIAGRGGGKRTGEIKLNGRPITRAIMRQECKVVPQHDYLIAVLTAREALTYTAQFCLPKNQCVARVNETLQMLSLEECADVACGDAELKGLSGGQRKRVSIGMELLSSPGVLLLDEPTSGLDSKVAADVIRLIRNLTRLGRTVVCTIHQPSFQIFSLFDNLLLLDKGCVVYNGSVSSVNDYFSEIGLACPSYVNPADHMLQVLTEEVPSGGSSFAELFEKSTYGAKASQAIKDNKKRLDEFVSDRSRKPVDLVRISSLAATRTIFVRAFKVTTRDKAQLQSRFMQLTVMGLLIGAIFFQMDFAQDRVQDRLSALFMFAMMLTMSSIMATAMALPVEKAAMLREYTNGYYSMGAFYVGRLGCLLLFQIFYAILLGVVTYLLVGLYLPRIVNTLIILILLACIAGTIGFTASMFFPTAQAVTNTMPMLVAPLMLFAGLFIKLDNIPIYFVWLYYLSFIQYALRAMMINEFRDRDFEICTFEDAQDLRCPLGVCLGPGSNSTAVPVPCPGEVALEFNGYDTDDELLAYGILIVYLFAVLILGLIALRRLLRKAQ